MTRRLLLLALAVTSHAAEIRVGIIGTDTSHVPAFTKLLNDPADPQHVPGCRVVAAVKAGSADIESSATRVEKFAAEIAEKWGVEIVPDIATLLTKVDAVLIESVDGRPHLDQARPVIAAKKRLFIDKPLAGSLRDAVEIFRLAREGAVPVFTSSSYRFYGSLEMLRKAGVGDIRSVISSGPCHLEKTHPDLFWYGVHPMESLFTVMGRGCESVARTHTANTDIATGVWRDGRIGILHGLRGGPMPYKATIFGSKAVAEQKPGGPGDSYAPLVREIAKFFQTGTAPVAPEETIEMFAFMEAADESKRLGGAPVKLADVLAKAGWKP